MSGRTDLREADGGASIRRGASLRNVLTIILAGGEGKRLHPLTRDRAKPAIPFGGSYRIIDFVLNNFINSGLYRIKVLTQYKSESLNEYLMHSWRLATLLGQYVDPVPPQMRTGAHWFRGTADAVYQNLNLIFNENPDHVCVFGGDHIYRMDVQQMIAYHVDKGAEVTISAVPVPVEEAHRFGILEMDASGRAVGFEEKPKHPKTMPGDPTRALASMGNYIFTRDVLTRVLEQDALRDTSHDFGQTIIPGLLEGGRLYVYNFLENRVPGATEAEHGYWRDVGTLEAYFEANMDLIRVSPVFSLYNESWPIRSRSTHDPPAKFVFANEKERRMGIATDSLVAEGCIISGGRIDRSVLFRKVRVDDYARVDEAILMDGVQVGRHAHVRRVIVDKGVRIPDGIRIGFDPKEDRARGFHVSETGIVVIPKGHRIED